MQWFRNFAYVLVVIIGFGYLLSEFQEVLFPIFFAMFFSFLLMPLEGWLFRLLPVKFFSITLSIVLVVGAVSGIVFLFGNQLMNIVQDLSSIQDQIKDGLQTLLQYIDRHVPYLHLGADEQSIDNVMSKVLDAPIAYVAAGISNGAIFLFNVVLTLIYTIFILIYKEAFRDFVMIQFSKDKREELGIVLTESVTLIQRYLIGMVTVVIILATMNCIGLLIIGVKYAVFWGVLAACLVIIPYIGTTIGGTLPFLYSLATSEYSWQPWAVVIMYVCIQ